MANTGPALPRLMAGVARTALLNALLLVCSVFGLGWSSGAQAIIGCEIQPVGSTTQSGPINTDVTFQFSILDITGGCGPSVSGTVIAGSDSTGGAIASPTSWSGKAGDTITITVTLGPTANGTANFTVDCPDTDCSGGNLTIGLTANSTAPSADMSISKSAANSVSPGDPLSFTIDVGNNGPSDAGSVQMDDTLPAGVTFSALTSPGGWSCSTPAVGSGGTVTCTIATLASGGSGSFTLDTTVDSNIIAGSISNTATVSTSTADPTPGNDTATSFTSIQQPLLTVVKAFTSYDDNDNSGSVTIGDTLHFTVTATASNFCDCVLSNVVVSDPLLTPNSVTCTSMFGGGTCVLDGTYTVTLSDALAGSVSNTGSANADQLSSPISSNTVVTPVTGVASLTATKALAGNADGDNSGTVTQNDVLTFTVTAHNNGTLPLNNVQVSDPLTTPSSKTCATLAIGADCVLSGTYTVTQANVTAGSISNTGHAQSTELATGVDSNTLNTAVASTPVLTATKAFTNNADGDGSGTITQGDVLTYTVTAHNGGNVALTNVQVSDPLTSPSSKTCATLAIGADCVLSGTHTVTLADVTAGSISNTGHAQSTEIPNGVDSNTLNTSITSSPAMTVTKALIGNADGDNSGSVTQGDVLTYRVTAHNGGNVALANVQVTDPLTAPSSHACATLALGANCILTGTYTVTLADVTAGSISNTGHAQSTEFPNGIDSNALVTPVLGSPALSVTNVLSSYQDKDGSGNVSQGDVLTFKVTAHNGGNIALANVQVNDATTTPSTITCATLATGADCILTGDYTVTAADADAGSISNTGSAQSTIVATAVNVTVVTIVAPTTRVLQIQGGDDQVGTPGAALPSPFTVHATDNGAPAAGVGIVWTITSGDGTLSASGNSLAAANQTFAAINAPLVSVNSSTDSDGIASATLTLGPEPGPVTVSASREDDPSVSVSFSVNGALLGDLSGLNPKEKAIADAFDKFCSKIPADSSNSDVIDLRERCLELIGSINSDPDGVINALDELFPDLGLVLSESSLLAAQSQFENIKARIAALRSGTQGVSFGGLALTTGRGSLPIGLAFQSLLDGDNPGSEVGSSFSRWGFFAAGSIGRGNTDPGRINPGYDFDINGLTVGADYRKSDKFILGGTVGYTKQSNDLANGRGTLDTQGFSVSGFSTYYQNDSWYLDDVLSYGRNSYDMVRSVHYTIIQPGGATTHIDQSSHGSSNGNSLTFATSVGRDFNKNGLSFGPYLRAIYSRLTFDPLTESFQSGKAGSGLGLVIDPHDVTSLSSTLGAKLTFTHSTSWGVLIPHLQAEWQHEFKSDPSSLTAYFLNDPTATPFTVTGDPIDSDFYRMGVGLSFVLTRGRSGFIYYERLMGRDRISQDSLAFGLRLEF